MSRLQHLPQWLSTLLIAVVVVLAVRITMAVNAGLDGATVLRTYVFWAAVCASVAYLADMVVRSVLDYRLVRVVVNRVRSRR